MQIAKDFKYINWCEGVNEPKAFQIRNISYYFDISADYLLGIEYEQGNKLEIFK